MKFTFNTGRLYQTNGQIITTLPLPNQSVTLFKDHSRMICGEIDGVLTTPREVMRLYDNSKYRMSIDAMNLDPMPDDQIQKVKL